MKKLIFGFIATVLFATTSFANNVQFENEAENLFVVYENANAKTETSEVFVGPCFTWVYLWDSRGNLISSQIVWHNQWGCQGSEIVDIKLVRVLA